MSAASESHSRNAYMRGVLKILKKSHPGKYIKSAKGELDSNYVCAICKYYT